MSALSFSLKSWQPAIGHLAWDDTAPCRGVNEATDSTAINYEQLLGTRLQLSNRRSAVVRAEAVKCFGVTDEYLVPNALIRHPRIQEIE